MQFSHLKDYWIQAFFFVLIFIIKNRTTAFVNYLGKYQCLAGFLLPPNSVWPTSFYHQLIDVQTVPINVNIGSRKTITK